MRFTVLAVVLACRSLALRQQLGSVSSIAKVGNLVTRITTGATDSLVALKAATRMVNDICAETGNATDHLSADDEAVLRSVLDMVETTMYRSMDESHQADVGDLAVAEETVATCNTDIARRQSQEGDLGIMENEVRNQQTELIRLDGVVEETTAANITKWGDLDTHMQQFPAAPAVPDYPATPNKEQLDVYFEASDYVNWFDAQQFSFHESRDAFLAADAALEAAIPAYNTHLAVRNQAYCDWKRELEASCSSFDECFSAASDYYSNTLVPRVTSDMNDRIELKNAGDTLTHQIKFLLGDITVQSTSKIYTSRYEIDFPVLPSKGLCDLSVLGDAEWVPTPSCP